MKKIIFVLVVLLVAAFPVGARAGVDNNPNSFKLDHDCEGQVIPITIPVIYSSAGHVSGGGIAHPRTHYIDFDGNGVFEPNELVWSGAGGKGVQTIFCTWTWDNDPYVHGMDIQFVPPNP